MKHLTFHPTGQYVTVLGPSSLSNLGPGFDVLGLCIEAWCDEIDAFEVEESGVFIIPARGLQKDLVPSSPDQNTASVAANGVLKMLGTKTGMVLRIRKGVRPGSGIGSSAASAVAGAWAARELFGPSLSKDEVLDAALEGEALISGTRHGDNILPAMYGGLVMVHPNRPNRYIKLSDAGQIFLAVLLPEIQILTKTARDMLPKNVPLHEAIAHAADLAFLLEAIQKRDWESAGAYLMVDRLVEPIRATLVPCYADVKNAAIEAGAYGCSLSGSGPAMFSIAGSVALASAVLHAMTEACKHAGIPARGVITIANQEGVRTRLATTPTFPTEYRAALI